MANWTNEQRSAIDARGCNLLVAAAAGSGKTAVLVERILELMIKDGINIDSMLIVTFTNAAAGEMRERIGNAILKAIDEKLGNEAHLRRQLNLLSHASISTLHSFCIGVLRKYFHVIDLDPGFRIGDESETLILKMDAIENLMEDAYNGGDELFLGLVDRYGGNKQDTPLQELILKLYNFILSNPKPFLWLKEKIEEFKLTVENVNNSSWFQALAEHIRIELSGAIHILREAITLCNRPMGPKAYESAIYDDIDKYNELLKWLEKDFRACWTKASCLEFERLSKCGREVDEGLKEGVKKLRDDAKKIFSELKKNLFQLNLEDYIRDLNSLYPYMEALYNLVEEFDRYYKKEKEERGLIDFNDLEHYTLKVLENEDVASELKEKYNYIFIDEYQDSNIVQETIINRIKRDDNLFMVGDVKQSIYRFRLADPSLFIQKYNTYENREGVINRRIDLNKNFRSHINILKGVNLIFENIMSEELGEVSYDECAALHPGLPDEPPQPEKGKKPLNSEIELHLAVKASDLSQNAVEKSGGSNDEAAEVDERVDEIIEDMGSLEMEALIAAQRINELLKTYIYDKSMEEYRKVEYRDIVILMRSTKVWAQTFYEILSGQGFPVYADVNDGYFDSVEVSTIIDLLRLIDNKRQDIPLLAVMRSPIGGFDAIDMIKIRTSSKSKTFYEAAEDYLRLNNDLLSTRLNNFFNKLKEWQEAARHLNMEELLWKLYMDTGYFYYAGSMPGGIQRQANLNMLLEKARQFQNTSARGIFGFLQFIDKLKDSSGDMGVAKVLSENDNVIRIMSIHKSKGLEFPIVIVAGMGRRFNLKDTSAQVIIHKDIGIGPKYVDPVTRQTCDTIIRIAMKDVIRLESLSEEMRILYVAMTRAKHKLILLGSVNDMEKDAVNWSKGLNIFNLSRCKSFLDWICPVLMRHKDGFELREKVKAAVPGLYEQLTGDMDRCSNDSCWSICVHDRQKVLQIGENDAKKAAKLKKWLESPVIEPNKELVDLINERFNWKYPFRDAVYIPSKLTVTQIKKFNVQRAFKNAVKNSAYFVDSSSMTDRPKFMEGTKKFTAAQKGTITHFVLQHLKLDGDLTCSGIKKQIEDMVNAQLLTEEEGEVVDINKISKFFDSDVGRRVLHAGKVWREVPFNYRKEAKRLINDVEGCDETLLIQGVIDCYFEEDDKWVLVDYKTDFILNNKDLDKIVSQYRIQIELYAEALENITGKPVKEKILYLFSIDRGVTI